MNSIKKIIGIIVFGFFFFTGIIHQNTNSHDNIYFVIMCGLITVSLFLSLFKKKKANNTSPDLDTGLQVEYSNNYPDEYLDQILPDGRTIREVRKENLEEALLHYDCRSDEEENLISDFYTEFEQTLSLAEEKLYRLANDISHGKTLDERILNVRKVISHYEHFKNFCYSKGSGGRMYFDDMWEHCHNSKNPDFSYIDQFKELLEKWIERRDERDGMASIRKNF